MKKFTLLSLLMFLATSTIQAKFFNGTINFADGTEKAGLLERPSIKSGKIKFKLNEMGQPQLVDSDLLSSVTITTDKGTETFLYLHAAMELKNGIKKESGKKWFAVMSMGNVNFLYYKTDVSVNDAAPGIEYHIHVPGHDYAVYFTTKVEGVGKIVGTRATYRDMVMHLFDDICPEFAEKFRSREYKTDSMEELIKMYQQTCG